MRKMLVLCLSLMLTSCGTMRLQVKADYHSTKEKGHLLYERSYSVGGGMPLWCALSAIYFGGACWLYLGMPLVPQEKKASEDALEALKKESKDSGVVLENVEIKRLSWGSAEPYFRTSKLPY